MLEYDIDFLDNSYQYNKYIIKLLVFINKLNN